MYSVLPPALKAFHQAYPDVELKLFEMLTEEQADALRDKRIHIGIGIGRQVQDIPGCTTDALLSEPLMAVLAPDHPLAASQTVLIADLADSPLVLYPRQSAAVFPRFVEGLYRDAGLTPDVAHRADEIRTAIALVAGALDALKAQQAHTKLAGGLIFQNPTNGEQWAGDKPIRGRWERILLKAGVRYRNPYQTRHTYASSLLMLGANPLYVATQLGHVDTTLVFRTYGRWISAGLNNDKRQRLLCLYA
jgi:hypothetical protein